MEIGHFNNPKCKSFQAGSTGSCTPEALPMLASPLMLSNRGTPPVRGVLETKKEGGTRSWKVVRGLELETVK